MGRVKQFQEEKAMFKGRKKTTWNKNDQIMGTISPDA